MCSFLQAESRQGSEGTGAESEPPAEPQGETSSSGRQEEEENAQAEQVRNTISVIVAGDGL